MLFHARLYFTEKRWVVVKKADVKFKPFDAQGGRQTDPLGERHRAMNAQLVHEAFWKGREFRFHLLGFLRRVSTQQWVLFKVQDCAVD
jgi:hypothetical protein